jgi:hypothetical protein
MTRAEMSKALRRMDGDAKTRGQFESQVHALRQKLLNAKTQGKAGK